MSRLRMAPPGVPVSPGANRRQVPGTATAGNNRADAPGVARSARPSNALKDFLWHLSGLERGRLLDLGPAWQTTLSFFLERGFSKVYTEDLLKAWKEFLALENERLRRAPAEQKAAEMAPAACAERFLANNLKYPSETFDAVLAWDLLDYFDLEMVTRVVARLAELVKPGGAVLALFHGRKPESFHRYRVLDPQNLELLPAPALLPPLHVYQNREILNLFGRFRSSKTFVGRDLLREGLFIR